VSVLKKPSLKMSSSDDGDGAVRESVTRAVEGPRSNKNDQTKYKVGLSAPDTV